MQAFVSDQSSAFNSVVIGTGPDFTVVASLKLPPGSWVVFATVALGAATSALGTTVVQIAFQLDGKLYGTAVQSDFTITTLAAALAVFGLFPSPRGWFSTCRKLWRSGV